MSFLVKTILGQNVVHPQEHASNAHTAAEMQDSTQQTKSNMHSESESRDVNRVPTRTLLLRVQSCTIAQDRRDALRELQNSIDLPYVMAASELSYLCSMLRNFPEDEEIVDASLAILSGVTDLGGYPAGSTLYNVTEKEKYRIRDSFLHELVVEVPLFLGYVREGGFWTRFHSVQLLQRLQEYDPPVVHKLLLSSHGIGVLVDILNDISHGGALRNEGLVLITAITATDTELQTLLAFDNAFETLFTVVNEEGGLDGGVIVSDCLTIVHNMLRNNKATHKLFRDMGCPKYLSALMDAALARVRSAVHDRSTTKSSAPFATASTVDGGSTNLFTPLTNAQSVIVVMTVSIINCVLREAEAQHDVSGAQDTLLECGVLAPLAGLALGDAAVNDAARVEAMRALAVLLQENRIGIENFLQVRVVTLLSVTAPLQVEEWSALRATLHVLFDIEDRVMQLSAAKVLHTLLSLQECEESVFQALVKGFVVPDRNSMGLKTFSLRSMGLSSAGECGAAIAQTLFGGFPSAHGEGQYYAALLLDRIVSISSLADQLLNVEPCNPAPSKAIPGRAVLVQEQSTAVTHTAPMTESVFTAFVQYTVRCICGHGEMDLNTLSACFRTLIRWMRTSPRAVMIFLADKSFYKIFSQRVTQEDGPSHVRLWSAVLCAALCVLAPLDMSVHKETDDSAPVPLMSKQKLLESFINDFGGPSIFETISFDVKASSPAWSDPPSNAFLNPAPVMYDIEMKDMLLEIIEEFKGICPVRNKRNSGGTPPKIQERDTFTATSRIGICAVIPPVTDRLETIIGTHPVSNATSECIVSEGALSPKLASFSDKVVGTQSPIYSLPPQQDQRMMEIASPSIPTFSNSEKGTMIEHFIDAIPEAYETQILTLKQRNSELEQELELYRQKEQYNADVLLEMSEREKQHTTRVTELQETIQLLEEALTSKDEEQQVLVQSLNMLDEQLRAALANADRASNNPQPNTCTMVNGEAEELLSLRSSMLKLTQERDELLLFLAEIHGERTMGMSDQVRELTSLPPPPPSHAPSAESRGSGCASICYTNNHNYTETQNNQVYAQQHALRHDTTTPQGTSVPFSVDRAEEPSPSPLLPSENTADGCHSLQRDPTITGDSAIRSSSTPSAMIPMNFVSNVLSSKEGDGDRGISFDGHGRDRGAEDYAIGLPDEVSLQESGREEQQQKQQKQDASQRTVSHNPFSSMKGPYDADSEVLF